MRRFFIFLMVFIGNFDPLKLQFELLNLLLQKGKITANEAKKILKTSLNPELKEEEKERIVDSLFIKK